MKRIFAVVLVIALCLTLTPGVFASGEAEEVTETEETLVPVEDDCFEAKEDIGSEDNANQAETTFDDVVTDAGNYIIRSSPPETSNNCYYNYSYNPFYTSRLWTWCTWYAFGRAYEILGKRPDLSTDAASEWFSYNKNKYDSGTGGYPYSTNYSSAKVGAVACYTNHVQVVESVGNDGKPASVSTGGSTGTAFYNKNNWTQWKQFRYGKDQSSSSFVGYIYICNGTSTGGTVNPVAPTISGVSVSGTSVTVSWGAVANATYYDVYLVQSPWGWDDIKYSASTTSASYTFSNVAVGDYCAFVIARPNADWIQSGWVELSIKDITDLPTSGASEVEVLSGVYVIHSAWNENEVLDIQNNSMDNRANIQLYQTLNSDVQKFRIIKYDDYYCLQSIYSQKWLDIKTPIQSNSNVQLWYDNSSTEEKWLFEDAGDGYVYVKSLTGYYLDVQGDQGVNNANIQVYPFVGNNSQKWKLEEVTNYVDVTDDVYKIHAAQDYNEVLDIQNNSTENRANIQIYETLNTNIQKFYIVKNDGCYCIKSLYSGKWLDIKTPIQANSNVQLWYDNSSTEEKWLFEDAGNGYVYIKSLTGYYLDVQGDQSVNNANVQVYPFTGNNFQKWVLEKNSYTVTYNANGGTSAPAAQTKTHDVALTLSTTKPTRTGYTFQGWATTSTATTAEYSAGGSYTGNASVTLYAVWEEETYTVSYNAGSGTVNDPSFTVAYGSVCNLSENAVSLTGHNLIGWNLYRPADDKWFVFGVGWRTESEIAENGYEKAEYNKDLSMKMDASWFSSSSGNIDEFIFCAVWEVGSYEMRYNANGGTLNSSPFRVEFGSRCNLSENAVSREGCTLTGWNLYRPADNAWFVFGIGWCTTKEITENAYTKGLYEVNASLGLDTSWFRGTSGGVDGFVFYAVWSHNGDVNGDGTPTAYDLVVLMKYLSGASSAPKYPDVNSDGVHDLLDLVRLMKLMANRL